MSTKEELLHLIRALDDIWVDDVLDYVRWLQHPTDTLTPTEFDRVKRGERQLERGEHITLDEWRRQHPDV